MRFAILPAALGALLAAPAFAAPAADDAGSLLISISEASRTANYQGVIVYQGDGALETMRVTHRFQDGVERERVQSLTGEPREVIKLDSKVTSLLPRNRKLTAQRPTPKGIFLGLTPERMQQIAQVYDFREIGASRVAGRACRGVAINPKDDLRYGYQVWADDKTHVPLKVSLIAGAGELLEQMMFTEVDFPVTVPDTAFQTELDSSQYREVTRTLTEPVPPPVAAGGQFDRLPPGFHVTMRDVRPLPDGHGTVEHLLLSDGLSSISVFTARHETPARAFEGASRMGAVSAYGRLVGRVHITVVGEAPQETVKLIGDSVKPGSDDSGDATRPASARKP